MGSGEDRAEHGGFQHRSRNGSVNRAPDPHRFSVPGYNPERCHSLTAGGEVSEEQIHELLAAEVLHYTKMERFREIWIVAEEMQQSRDSALSVAAAGGSDSWNHLVVAPMCSHLDVSPRQAAAITDDTAPYATHHPLPGNQTPPP